jgi:DNA-binding sugar fermentation-stimulating protein
MKSLCLVLLLAIATPSCSMFTQKGRTDRAYDRQMKRAQKARDKRARMMNKHVTMPSLRNSQTVPTLPITPYEPMQPTQPSEGQ